jgi:hypothetical protein
MLVSSFNLLQSFSYTSYLFYKYGSNQRSILSVYGPWVLRIEPEPALQQARAQPTQLRGRVHQLMEAVGLGGGGVTP